jgi:HPt (histidine-containing phosphotransfer) domain-containing protein
MKADLNHLQQLLGSAESAAAFLDLFRRDTPEQLNHLKKALETGDWEQAEILAHGLKSQCRYLGMESTADLLAQLEKSPAHPQAMQWYLEVMADLT